MSPRPRWNYGTLRIAIEKFVQENKRHPRAEDFDRSPFLPSARQIQRKFGGLPRLRTTLGFLDTHYGRGDFRSAIASSVGKRGEQSELEVQKVLTDRFGEIAVHVQRPITSTRQRFDFYVFTREKQFGLDVFYPKDLDGLQRIINIKERIYRKIKVDYDVIFLCWNEEIFQRDIDTLLLHKKILLPENIKVFVPKTFESFLDSLSALRLC